MCIYIYTHASGAADITGGKETLGTEEELGRKMGRGRAPCCEKVGLNKGSWTPEEDLRLMAYIQKHGHANWRALPRQAGLLRCGKSCRLRWINYLRPDIKRGNFTKEEEDSIIKLHGLLGNKWSKIAACLPGRTDNEIKNVWNTHLKKRLALKDRNPHPNKFEEPPSSPSTSASMSCSAQREGNSSDGQPMNPNLNSTKGHDVGEKDQEPWIDKIEIPIEPNLDMWDLLEVSALQPTQYPNTEEISKWNESLEECFMSPGSNSSKDSSKESPSSSSSNFFVTSEECVVSSTSNPSNDTGKETSCTSSSNSFMTNCNVGTEALSQDPTEYVRDILIDAEMWNEVDHGSILFGCEVQHKDPASLEEESNKEDENKRWLTYLEEELGLWGASEDTQQGLKRDAVDMECDPVSSYFQRGPSSTSPLELLDCSCLDTMS